MSRVINHLWKNGGDNSASPTVFVLENGHVLITADADTDADGSPDADEIDDTGLLQTALGKDNGWKGDGDYVNARIVPYYVLPGNWKSVTNIGCKLGDIAKISYKNKIVYAIYADIGPDEIIGEASIATVEALGHNPWNNERTKIVSGIPHGVTYEIIPKSSNLTQTVNFETIQAYGKAVFGETSPQNSSDIQRSVTWLELNRSDDGTPAITAYAGQEPKYTRFYQTKESLIGFLQAFPNAHTALVAENKPIPDCPDFTETPPHTETDSARKFVTFFKDNYAAVRREVERWFIDNIPVQWSTNAVTNGCVAHQVSCLYLCELPHPKLDTLPSVNVDKFVEWALSHNWTKITSMDSLKPGDICVSGPTSTNLDHVYCFVDYINTENAHVLHNQVFGLATRSLVGNGCGQWRFALRMP
jgi:hypothetical protein